MIQRVMPELMGMKNILVINDEAHHCYRERPDTPDEEPIAGEEKDCQLPATSFPTAQSFRFVSDCAEKSLVSGAEAAAGPPYPAALVQSVSAAIPNLYRYSITPVPVTDTFSEVWLFVPVGAPESPATGGVVSFVQE